MRAIKFRGISIATNDWVYGDVLIDNEDSYIFERTSGWYELRENLIRVPTETLGQFTGLLDRNGKEIYEGDIIDYKNDRHYPVIFYKGCYCMKGLESMTWLLPMYEIIGNIYEHKELLK